MIALALLCAVVMRPAAARADGSDRPPGPSDRVLKIGPQAVVIVNQRGDVRMFDDPAEGAPACRTNAKCANSAIGILSLFFLATYLELTDGIERSSGSLQRFEPGE